MQFCGGVDGFAYAGVDLGVPLASAKNAVVADAGLEVVDLEVRGDAGAEVLRGDGLAYGADVVALAFDGEEGGLADGGGVDLALTYGEFAARKVVGLEDAFDRFQIELGRQIVDREVFV